jgi:para-nitrobenzyl esterase
MLARAITFAALATITSGAAGGTPLARGQLVTVEQGRLAGTREGQVSAFLGIPYAAPPVGPNRWRAPQPPGAWKGIRQAQAFGASCFQPYPAPEFGPYTKEFVDTPPPSEDCLFLNLWTPTTSPRNLPVLVWIHGGGFIGGSGAVPIYDGANLAAKGAVVVTINYRVGPLGFLSHPALSAEDPHHSSGEYGLLDQIAALKWVERNIRRFGGDPANVTIAGQSAGAASVNDLIVSPLAKGLFRRAVAESGSGMGVESQTLSAAEREGVQFANYLGARSAADLRALPAEKIQSALYLPIGPTPPQPDLPKIRFRPPVDGYVLPQDGANGNSRPASAVPLITGFTRDENFAIDVKSPADLETEVRGRFGKHADRILALYPHANAEEAIASARLLARDRYMASLVLWTNRRATSSHQTIYRYRFDQPVPVASGPSFGAFHTAEVPYLFGVLDTRLRPYTAADRKVSAQVQGYWLHFMRSGDPNGAGLATWPNVTAGSRSVLAIQVRSNVEPAVSTEARFEALRAFVADGGSLSLF